MKKYKKLKERRKVDLKPLIIPPRDVWKGKEPKQAILLCSACQRKKSKNETYLNQIRKMILKRIKKFKKKIKKLWEWKKTKIKRDEKNNFCNHKKVVVKNNY